VPDSGGSSFATKPVAPGGGRRPRLLAWLVLAVVVGSFAIARLTPGPGATAVVETERPAPTPTPTSSVTATPVQPRAPAVPVATTLPRRVWFGGPEPPIQDLLVEAGTVRRLSLTAGRLSGEALAEPARDLLLRGTDGGTVCLCWSGATGVSVDAADLDLVHRDGQGGESSRRRVTIGALDGVGGTERHVEAALEPGPDGRLAYLARTARTATAWQVSLDAIDLDTATVVGSVDLVPLHDADRSVVRALGPPTLRIAPDGRHALVMSAISRETSAGTVATARHAWVVGLDGPDFGGVTAADAIADALGSGCLWVGFATPAIVAEGCDTLSASLEIRRYDLAGRDLGSTVGDPPEPHANEALLDSMHGVAYTWDPVGHLLLAIDLADGAWRSTTVGKPTGATENPAEIVIEAARPSPGPATVWSNGRPATDVPRDRTLVGSPDGRLLYAAGFGARPGSSSGIWVFDTQTLKVIEHWPARTAYTSVTLFENGRWLAAVGRPGVTAGGGPAEWGTSMTIHETLTGRQVLLLGDLAVDEPLTFPGPGPEAVVPAGR
jgi:hypothetical protein